MSFLSFDLETTIKVALKRKASPFYNLNRIVAVGYKRKDDTKNSGIYYPTTKNIEGEYEGGAPDGWFKDLLEGTSLLVGFNIKFDILHAICQGPLNRTAWVEYIDRGGMVWDCQLAEYLLHGMTQEYHMAAMDEVAPSYGGNIKDDAVKSLWNAGVDTCDIDKTLLMDYLVGTNDTDDIGDIGNTERMFLGQLAAFRARGGLNSAMLNMGALCFTIEAEYNGMFVDKEWALAKAAELLEELKEADRELEAFIPEDLPFQFNWNSRFHKSALIFGGQVKYVAKENILDEDGNLTYYQKDAVHYVLQDGSTMECSWWEHCMYTEWKDSGVPEDKCRVEYKSGKNKGEYKTKKVKVPDIERGPKQRNADFYYTFPGHTEPDPKWESKSDPGVYSTAAEVIEELGARDIPFLKALARRADLHKDLSTYYIATDEKTGEQKGMLTLVGPDGIIHHKLNMNTTVTGRLSSSDPNLQNVSKGEHDEETGEEKGSQIKRAFVSRFRSGGKIIQSDFTSLEIFVQAILTDCKQLIEDLKQGLDMHVLRAEQAWGKEEGKDYDYILSAAKDDKHPEHRKWHKKRTNAKVFSFQRAYGAGVQKIAATTGMSVEEVEALVQAELERYPEIDAFIEKLTEEVKANRRPTNRFVDHPDVRGLVCQLGRSHYTTPDGKMYSFSESPSPRFLAERPVSKGGCAQSFSPTELKNYPVQGTGGEWAKAAMYLALRAFYRKGNFGGLALLVNQVHDALYVDAADDVATEAAALLHACMIEASNYMEWWFKWPLPLGVPSETKMGNNMMEERNPPEEFKALSLEYQAWVREHFCGNHVPTYEKEN